MEIGNKKMKSKLNMLAERGGVKNPRRSLLWGSGFGKSDWPKNIG